MPVCLTENDSQIRDNQRNLIELHTEIQVWSEVAHGFGMWGDLAWAISKSWNDSNKAWCRQYWLVSDLKAGKTFKNWKLWTWQGLHCLAMGCEHYEWMCSSLKLMSPLLQHQFIHQNFFDFWCYSSTLLETGCTCDNEWIASRNLALMWNESSWNK